MKEKDFKNVSNGLLNLDFASLYPSSMKIWFSKRNRIKEINKVLNRIKNV